MLAFWYWGIILALGPGGYEELYDLVKDPGEREIWRLQEVSSQVNFALELWNGSMSSAWKALSREANFELIHNEHHPKRTQRRHVRGGFQQGDLQGNYPFTGETEY